MSFERELEVARRLALEAGDIALRYHGTELKIERKDEGEPVTRADKEANAVIVGGLQHDFPDDALLAEETPDDGSRLRKSRVWMVDPIDGTRDFIRGRDGFSVMIGLLVDGRPAMGVVWQPIGKRLYYATRGDGAFLAEGDGAAAARIHTSDVKTAEQIRLVASQSHRTPIIDEVRKKLGISDELNVGSVGLKLGLIARGLRDLYVNPSSKSSAWDTCGPEAILVEAGGRLTDLWGREIDYRAADVKNRDGLVASNGALHELVLEKIRPLFPDGAQSS
jgi:3'(2'), 5'-bisphosphate nucleotidase